MATLFTYLCLSFPDQLSSNLVVLDFFLQIFVAIGTGVDEKTSVTAIRREKSP